MEFRVLGPLEVLDGEHAVRVRGGRRRALLALLLVRANEVVPVDRLIDELWGERAPPSAPKIVQVYVSDLRKALGADVLVTHSPGYLLRVEPEQVDAIRFERLLAQARGALARGAAEDASRTLVDALRLWRGPALVDFSFEAFAQAEIARLEDLRLAALEERIEADLTLGRHAELVPELETLVVRHPLRERIRAQLMLALYRCGRQAEALHVYQDARHALVDELGIEPGQALQQLERRILQQDERLSPPAPAAGSPGSGRLVTVMSVALEAATELGAGRGDQVARRILDARTDAIPAEIERHGGRCLEPLGGGVTATFPTARTGVACAVALQRLFADEPGLRLRIGVNLGETLPDSSQPLGAVLSAARIAAGAGPDEIVVTDAVKHLAGGSSDLGFRDRGHVEVEGFPEPWRLHEVLWANEQPAR